MGKRNRNVGQHAVASSSVIASKIIVPPTATSNKLDNTEQEPRVESETHASTSVQKHHREKKKKGMKEAKKSKVEKDDAEEDESDDDDEVHNFEGRIHP